MPTYWTASRIANQLHHTALAPFGFVRAGRICERLDGGLRRTLSVHTRTSGSRPQVQLNVGVAVADLPTPVTSHRCDSLNGTAETAVGREWYPLPASDQPLPSDLLADVSGPLLEFLLAAKDLDGFVLWAQDIYLGHEHPGWWGRFRPVLPQGTGPLEAAAFAAAAKGDTKLVEFLTARVENEQVGEHHFDDFLAELRQLHPGVQQRHPIVRPVT
ncbi:hypothetical protein GCM10009827_087330 [Dactylosporangium maewongense]|uniref:DUF4304 domain-containing protein n=1 Tax=Dactylosporangium maewongense TaxID=634393 RepID=A0ABN2C7R3_9ACTN